MSHLPLMQRFLEAQDLKIIRGRLCTDLFLPYLLWDCQYQIFDMNIKGFEMKGYIKTVRDRWAKQNSIFSKSLFRNLKPEECEEMTDLMDEFEEYIRNDVSILKSHVVSCIPTDVDFEKRLLIGDSMSCNILAQCAQIVWGSMFKTPAGNNDVNPIIRGIENLSHRMACEVHNCDKQTIDLNKERIIHACVDGLKHKIVLFLRSQDEPEAQTA